MARIYNDSARDRIRKAVIYTERRRTKPQRPRPSRRFTGDQMFTAILSDDLEHKQIGKAKVAKGATFEVGAFTAEREVDVWNPGRMLWKGAEIQCLTSSLAQPSYGSDGRKFTVVEAWSATIVKGKAASTINAGSSGTLNTLEPIDGVYQPSTLTAELPAGFEDVASGASVFAQLTWRASGSVWIIREGAASGPGGPPATTTLPCMTLNWEGAAKNPNLYLAPNQTKHTIAWHADNLIEAGTGMAFSDANDSVTYDPGDYLLFVSADCDLLALAVYPTYPSPSTTDYEDLEGEPIIGGVRIGLQSYNGAVWNEISWNGAYCNPDHRLGLATAAGVFRLKVPTGPSLEVRLFGVNGSTDSNDATPGIFHARWHSLKIG